MKSEWKVMTQSAGGEKFFRIYRLRDRDAVMHSGNIEFYTGVTLGIDRETAHKKARELNRNEEERTG